MTNLIESLNLHVFRTKLLTRVTNIKSVALSPKKKLTPFTITEILELIFKLLPPESLAHASLVSKRWYRISQRFTADFTYWDDRKDSNEWIIDRINIKRVLLCNFLTPFYHERELIEPTSTVDRRWDNMLEHLPRRKSLAPGFKTMNIGPTISGSQRILRQASPASMEEPLSPPIAACPIRNLYLSGYICPNNRLLRILPYVSASLTKLDLRFQQRMTIDLLKILKCPRLTFLHLEGCNVNPFLKQHGEKDEEDNKVNDFAFQEDPMSSLPLQALILVSVQFGQPSLEHLLGNCPNMREFRVGYKLDSRSAVETPYNEVQLLRKIGTFRHKIDTIQLSQLGFQQSSNERLLLMLEEIPKLNTVCIQSIDFTPEFYHTIVSSPLRITVLEITQTPATPALAAFREFDDKLLHRFLCLCPTLLHLYAYDVFMDIQHLDDIHSFSDDELQSKKNDLWACRNLKTLQLSFKCLDISMLIQQRQRKVLEFIPVVCPLLEHLQVDLFEIDLTLESGLSLLSTSGSGLPRLETLSLGTSVIHAAKKGDIEWMSKRPSMILQLERMLKSNDDRPRKQLLDVETTSELWPRWTKFRIFYDSQNKETNTKIKQLRKLIAEVRPGVDFKVVKSPKHEMQLW
ncbi:hypothetical protein BGX27_005146 [Mortierella sp. AM989]|nr:hypothetical protein BGX27_005146 [Mortierella sp. AM989]